MPLNWLSNLEFTKEDPYKWNTKDLKTQQNEIRDLNRKRAIERSMSNSLDANGNFSESALRSNLIKEGFGEDADRITNEMTSSRTKKADESLALKEKATNLYSQGIINQDEYNRLVGNEKRVVEAPVEKPTTSSETDWQDFSKDPEAWKVARGESQTQPQAKEGEILVQGKPSTPEDKNAQWGAFGKFRDKKVENVPSQFAPKYATFGSEVDLNQYLGKPVEQKSSRAFELSSDPITQDLQKKSAETTLGFSIDPKKDSNEQISQKIQETAEANNPTPLRSAYKDIADYRKAITENQAKINQDIQKLVEAVQTQSNAKVGQGLQARGVAVSEAGNVRAEEEARMPGFDRAMTPTVQEKANQAISTSNSLNGSLDQLKQTKPNTEAWNGLKISIAKDVMINYGLPVTGEVMTILEDSIRNGTTLPSFFSSLLGGKKESLGEINQLIFKANDTKSIETLAKKSQDVARKTYVNYKPTDAESYTTQMFPIYKETPEERKKWIAENKQYFKSGAVRQLEAKKTPTKPTSPTAPRKSFSELQAERGKK